MTLPALLVLFTASGISGLIYEVVWLRYLTLVFGVTIYAVSTVLTVFMGGLALGGLVAGRVADRLPRPLRVYGLIEAGIGLAALLTPAAFGLLHVIYHALYPALPHDLTSLSLVRFLLACLVLLPPTTLMGATLPVVVRSSLARSESLGTHLSLLYACNTAGGILGAYLAGFILIGSAGVRATTLAAAALNLAVGLAALALDRLLAGRPAAAPPTDRSPADTPEPGWVEPPLAPAAGRWLLAAFFVSGLASLAYQVIWTRILSIFFEATTYAFNLILCTFLLGLAAGSYAIAPLINRRANWLLLAGLMEWTIGLTAILSITAISRLNSIVEAVRRLPVAEYLVSGEQRETALFAFLTMFPTTLLLGAAFPVVMKLYTGAAGAGRRLGRAYATNVCGAIAGSWLAGFVLLPLLGSQRSLLLLAGVNVAVALGLLGVARPRAARLVLPAGALLAAGIALRTPDMYRAVFARFGDPVQWYEEGLEQTVTVLQGPTMRRMFLNGWHQADDTSGTVRFHALIGHLPMLIQPTEGAGPADGERRVLVIGLGGGVTAGAAAAYSGAQLDVVELSASVVRGARYFDHVNGHVVDAPNAHFRTDDGRNYLLLTDRKYDVIMADVVQPQHAGSAALYSLEYYRLARAALKPNGVMVQWIDRRLPESQYQLLLRTFLQAFPYATSWVDGAFVIGANAPYRIDQTLIARRLAGVARGAAASVGLTSVDAVTSLFTANDDALRAGTGDGLIVTDDHPLIEFFRSLPGE